MLCGVLKSDVMLGKHVHGGYSRHYSLCLFRLHLSKGYSPFFLVFFPLIVWDLMCLMCSLCLRWRVSLWHASFILSNALNVLMNVTCCPKLQKAQYWLWVKTSFFLCFWAQLSLLMSSYYVKRTVGMCFFMCLCQYELTQKLCLAAFFFLFPE